MLSRKGIERAPFFLPILLASFACVNYSLPFLPHSFFPLFSKELHSGLVCAAKLFASLAPEKKIAVADRRGMMTRGPNFPGEKAGRKERARNALFRNASPSLAGHDLKKKGIDGTL